MKLLNHSPHRDSRCELEIRGLAEEVPSSSPRNWQRGAAGHSHSRDPFANCTEREQSEWVVFIRGDKHDL